MTIRERTACFLSKLTVRYLDGLLNRMVNGKERNSAFSLIHCNQSLNDRVHLLIEECGNGVQLTLR